MLAKFFSARLTQGWLVVKRQATFHALNWRLEQRDCQVKYSAVQESMLYVVASALPYHTSGYTTRSHEVIRALGAAGVHVHVLTRPGYPWDRKDRQQDAAGDETTVDDVRYLHASYPLNNRPVLQYALQAARVVAEVAARQRVAVIHAASNHVNALPALLAARQLGIPFHYEMRGLWELTRVSRQPQFERSQAYKQGLQLEALVARHADRLFVISEQLGRYVRENWSVPAERIALLPNCVTPERFAPADPQAVEANTIGYAGTLIAYEGLDTLIEAVAILAGAGHQVRLELIGDGEARGALENQVRGLGLADRVRFRGRVPPDEARALLARCALVCIPRKPFKVCEIVPPIKLVEALAIGKPVIVPDLPVFRDELGKQAAGVFFRSGDAVDLARVLGDVLANPEEMRVIGLRARAYVEQHRAWGAHVRNVIETMHRRADEKQKRVVC